MKPITLFTFFAAVLVAGCAAQTQPVSCAKWAVLDLPFAASAVERPLETIFGATLTHESGEKVSVPGFFNGSGQWILRFSPTLEGRWTYETHASVPSLAARRGEIQVTPNLKPERHGAIRIAKNKPQRLAYEDGTSYFALSFEVDWLFALDAANPDDIPRTRTLVSHLVEHQFNQVVMNVYAYDAKWGERDQIRPEHNFARPTVFPYGGTNENPDHSRLNLEFFQRLDRVVAHLHDNEIVAHLMIYVWNKQVNWAKPYTAEDDLYFDYVVKRYQAYPNIIWDISKEALAYGRDDLNYITNRIDRLRRMDGHHRLVTVHDYTYCSAFPGKVDFISVQEWRPNLYNEMLTAAQKHPNRPILNIEHGGYEKTMHSIFNGAYTDPAACLDRNYLCVFAGVYSTYYWQNTSWYEVVYDPSQLPPDQQPSFRYYKYLRGLFDKYDFNRLEPKQYLFSPYCLTDSEKVFLYYLPRDMIALEGMAPPKARGKTVKVTWFNPLTGEYFEDHNRKIPRGGGAWTGFRKPGGVTSPMAIVILEVIE